MMVKFATLCDVPCCAARSDEYTAWPSCRDCGEHICDEHASVGTRIETDGERAETVQCQRCRDKERCLTCDDTGLVETCRADGEDCRVTSCPDCDQAPDILEAYNDADARAAAQARSNDFAATDGKDWT